jgi:ubiquinone/menaquinone biosynthesis C-methylase UbiE
MFDWKQQFVHPKGWLGHLAGYTLVLRNRERSEWVLSQLDVNPADRVLEIGFGPGADIQRVSRMLDSGIVHGIDHSETMLQQASLRNRKAVQSGKAQLRVGTADALPYADSTFDLLYSINVGQFWTDPQRELREIKRVLKPQGRLALAVQPRAQGATEEIATAIADRLANAARNVGFCDVRITRKQLKPVSIICVMGQK